MTKIGSLSFEILAETGQINKSLDATKEKIKDFAVAAEQGGQNLDASFNAAAKAIEQAWDDLGRITNTHLNEIKKLEAELKTLKSAAADAFMSGNDKEYIALNNRISAVQKEITARKSVLAEVDRTAEALRNEEAALESNRKKVEENEQNHQTLKAQLREVTEQLAEMEEAGLRGTEAYEKLQKEAGRLTNALGDARQQAKILAHDNAGLQGLIQGASGVAGAFSAAQGVIGMFTGENANLQKVMLKVQSLIAITNGLQQTANALNKDSYFRIVTLTKAKTMFTTATTAASGALQRFGISAGVANVAAKALVATLTLGLSVAITAAVALIERFITKNRGAAKAAEEFNDKVADSAKDSLGSITRLSIAYNKLGDNMEAKKRFIEDNQDAFNKLGVSIRDVAEAENLLIDNKQAFIDAQIAKAKAAAYIELNNEKIKEYIKLQSEIEAMPDQVRKIVSQSQYGKPVQVFEDNQLKIKKQKELQELEAQIRQGYINAAAAEQEGVEKLQEAGIRSITNFSSGANEAATEFVEGTIGWIEAKISDLQTHLKNMADPSAIAKVQARIAQLESQKNALLGQDEFTKQLEEKKKLYQEYFKWVNSSDAIVRDAAAERFADLLKEGNSYLQYLELKRNEILASDNPDQDALQKINAAIANEAKEAVLSEFQKGLETELKNAQNVLDMLEIIKQRKEELANDGSELDNGKALILAEQEAKVNEQVDAYFLQANKDYEEYLGKRVKATIDYEKNIKALRARYDNAETEEERQHIQTLISMYEEMYDLQIENWSSYYADLEQINADAVARYGSYEQRIYKITKDYEKRIKAAKIAGMDDIAEKLTKELNVKLLEETDQYKELFNDVSEISYKTYENTKTALLKLMEEALEAGKITAEQYEILLDRIREKGAEFAVDSEGMGIQIGLQAASGSNKIDDLQKYGQMLQLMGQKYGGSMGEGMSRAGSQMSQTANTLAIVDAIITAIYQTLRAVADTLKDFGDYYQSLGDSDTADELNDTADVINSVNEGAMSGWENLKSGNVFGAMADTVATPFRVLTTLNKQYDKDIEKSIKAHQDKVNDLGRAYNQLAWEIQNALTTAQYEGNTKLIENLRDQAAEYRQMAEDERDKKDSDEQTAQEYEEQAAELERQAKDLITNLRNDILQSDIKSIATELGDALISAFQNGENAAEAWGDTVNAIIERIVRNMMISKLIEGPINSIIEKYTSMWVDNNGDFAGWDVVNQTLPAMWQELLSAGDGIAAGFQSIMESYPELFGGEGDITTMAGAIKGASQESIDLLAGQTNAVRVNQLVGLDIARDQLAALIGIQGNTNLIYSILQTINGGLQTNLYDPLRARGYIS